MSFYGSTYFQLIDTFYKILVKNNGNNANTVADPSAAANQYASQASGRKGVLEFGTGNRWIYATQDENNANSYIFWHAKPDSKDLQKQEFKGGAVGAVTAPEGVVPVVLEPGSVIKASQFEFDKAGHIAVANDVYFQMPISETEQAIEDLQTKVGEPVDAKTENLFTRAKNADDAIEAVTDTADRIRDELGTYSTVFPNTGAYKYVSGTNMYKDFFTTFGSMDDFRTALYNDADSSKSLIDGILEFRDKTMSDIEVNSDNIGTQSRLANKIADDLVSVEEDITALQNKDSEIDDSIATLSTNLTITATAIRSEFKEVDDAIKDSIKTCNGRIDDLNATVGSNKSNSENSINNLTDTVNSNKTACDNRMKAIEEDADRLEGLIGDNANSITTLTGTVADNKSAAETAMSELSARITTLETESATSDELNDVAKSVGQNASSISNLSGRIDGVDSSIGNINQTVAQLNSTISGKADTSSVTTLETAFNSYSVSTNTALTLKADKTTVEEVQTQVSTLNTLVNTKASQESLNDVVAAVDTKAGVDALEKFMGLTNESIARLEAENGELRGLIEALTARVEALEKTPTTE